jgi:hypothetical protein
MDVSFTGFKIQFLALADEPVNLIAGEISKNRHFEQF